MSRLGVFIFLLLLLAVSAGGYAFGHKTFAPQRRLLQDDVATYTSFLSNVREERKQRPKLDADLKSVIDHTLGDTLESVDAKLRARLNRLGEELKLAGLTVGTANPLRKPTPRKSEFKRRGEELLLREEDDFVELPAWITGEGSLEQAARLVHRLEAEPWLKRLDQFRLEPRENGQRFVISVRLTTLFLPGHAPSLDTPATEYNPESFARFASLVEKNPFRIPPPPEPAPAPPPAQPAPPPQPPAAPPFPYEQWVITGIVQTPAGSEVWLVNRKSNESRILLAGEKLQHMEVVSARGEIAEFRLGEAQFSLAIGQSLGDRSPEIR